MPEKARRKRDMRNPSLNIKIFLRIRKKYKKSPAECKAPFFRPCPKEKGKEGRAGGDAAPAKEDAPAIRPGSGGGKVAPAGAEAVARLAPPTVKARVLERREASWKKGGAGCGLYGGKAEGLGLPLSRASTAFSRFRAEGWPRRFFLRQGRPSAAGPRALQSAGSEEGTRKAGHPPNPALRAWVPALSGKGRRAVC